MKRKLLSPFTALTSLEEIIFKQQPSTSLVQYQCFQQTHVETFYHTDLCNRHSPSLPARKRIVLHISVSCSFLHIPGEELASDKVNQLGLRAEHGNDGCCKAHSPNADVNQPCHPTLITAEEYLKQRKQAIAKTSQYKVDKLLQ